MAAGRFFVPTISAERRRKGRWERGGSPSAFGFGVILRVSGRRRDYAEGKRNVDARARDPLERNGWLETSQAQGAWRALLGVAPK
jgi:hypothetical protein